MVDRNSSRHIPDSNTAAIHDMAFYPLCKYMDPWSICLVAHTQLAILTNQKWFHQNSIDSICRQ